MVHVSVKAEEILNIFGLPITNSMILSWIVIGIFLIIGVYYASRINKRNKSPFFYILHTIFKGVYNLIQSVLHDKAIVFYSLLGAYFFYILINNWMGMLPTVGSVIIRPLITNELSRSRAGGVSTLEENEVSIDTKLQPIDQELENPIFTEGQSKEPHLAKKIPLLRANTADLNTTFALALITVFMIQYYGLKYNGLAYLKKFINFSSPIMFFVGILELISELARILSFSFRLFGNVLAGEILITIIAFLIHPIVSFIMLPFFGLELMAGAIQAMVFMMLSTVLINMATSKAQH